jgi:glycerol-3-phosphate dehydrogenase subunit C
MKGIDLIAPTLERSAVVQETLRIFEVCDGCRRCFNLCPSFSTLFERIDAGDSDLSKLATRDFEQVADECYYCKLCYNHCPYTPPHQYEIDFPRLMVGWKKLQAQEGKARWRDRLLVRTDWIGKLGTLVAPLANWANAQTWFRGILHRIVGIHRDRQLVRFQEETFPHWLQRTREDRRRGLYVGRLAEVGAGPPPAAKVVLFSTCLVDYHSMEVGQATVAVLEKNGVEVVRPEQQCCGMPLFDTGDISGILKKAQANVATLKPWVDRGYDIIAPVPSCSLMLKREYPHLLQTEDAKLVASHTFDVCEYLMKLKKQGKLDTNFPNRPGKIAYQIPCHLRDQNIGFKSKELMELTGASVEVIERCSGHDGTWGVKVEFFDLSMKIAAKAVREVEAVQADLVVSDCPLSGVQLTQAGGGKPTLHPIEVVKRAYGL